MDQRGFGCILVPTDFSPCAEEAWGTARRLARALGAELRLLHVVAESSLLGGAPFALGLAADAQAEAAQAAREELARRVEEGRAEGLEVSAEVRVGEADRQILEAAAEAPADLVVLGIHGGIARAVLGSVADRVIRLAPCPVVTVRAGA